MRKLKGHRSVDLRNDAQMAWMQQRNGAEALKYINRTQNEASA